MYDGPLPDGTYLHLDVEFEPVPDGTRILLKIHGAMKVRGAIHEGASTGLCERELIQEMRRRSK